MCQHCCRLKSYEDVIYENHAHDSLERLKAMLTACRGKDHGVDPDAFRGDFMQMLGQGCLIPDACQEMVKKYKLYPKPIVEEEPPVA
jgi:hypothetical protein